jgi:hypothetical protein
MKEIRNTIENIELYTNRCAGNSTRQADAAINLLFKGYIVEVRDHWENGNNKQANLSLLDKIITRLKFEHRTGNINVDRRKLTIEIVD